MPGKAAKVRVSERQLGILQEFCRSRSEPAWVVQRATVSGRAFEGRWNRDLAPEMGWDRLAVGTWRWGLGGGGGRRPGQS